jgi:hypothetical protein
MESARHLPGALFFSALRMAGMGKRWPCGRPWLDDRDAMGAILSREIPGSHGSTALIDWVSNLLQVQGGAAVCRQG